MAVEAAQQPEQHPQQVTWKARAQQAGALAWRQRWLAWVIVFAGLPVLASWILGMWWDNSLRDWRTWWVHWLLIPACVLSVYSALVFMVWERIAYKVQPFLRFFGWGEDYDWDRNRLWSRKLDTAAYWVGKAFKQAFLSGAATMVYLVAFFAFQTYTYATKVSESFPKIPLLQGHPTLTLISPWIIGTAIGLLLIIPLVSSKFKASSDKAAHQELVEDHLIPYLERVMGELAGELKTPTLPDGTRFALCAGNIRVNMTIVRRHWCNRYLAHLASSDGVKRNDREVVFLLDEGLPGWAYTRPGDLLIERCDDATRKLRPSTAEKLSKSNKIVACRAIGLDVRKVQRPWFNRVVGVMIITSDNVEDFDRFKDPLFGDIVHTIADSAGKLVADIRRAYDA